MGSRLREKSGPGVEVSDIIILQRAVGALAVFKKIVHGAGRGEYIPGTVPHPGQDGDAVILVDVFPEDMADITKIIDSSVKAGIALHH